MKQGKRARCLFVVFFLLVLMLCSASAEAGVVLEGWTGTPRASNADPVGSYEYVLFGNYPQLQTAPTPVQPILWRVLSADQTGSSRKALLFSDKNLDAMAFDSRKKSPVNSYGTSGAQGAIWDDYNNNYAYSEIREFLVGYDNSGNFAPGGGIFAEVSYFSVSERNAVSADSFESSAGTTGTVAPAKTTVNPLFLLSRETSYEKSRFLRQE